MVPGGIDDDFRHIDGRENFLRGGVCDNRFDAMGLAESGYFLGREVIGSEEKVCAVADEGEEGEAEPRATAHAKEVSGIAFWFGLAEEADDLVGVAEGILGGDKARFVWEERGGGGLGMEGEDVGEVRGTAEGKERTIGQVFRVFRAEAEAIIF